MTINAFIGKGTGAGIAGVITIQTVTVGQDLRAVAFNAFSTIGSAGLASGVIA